MASNQFSGIFAWFSCYTKTHGTMISCWNLVDKKNVAKMHFVNITPAETLNTDAFLWSFLPCNMRKHQKDNLIDHIILSLVCQWRRLVPNCPHTKKPRKKKDTTHSYSFKIIALAAVTMPASRKTWLERYFLQSTLHQHSQHGNFFIFSTTNPSKMYPNQIPLVQSHSL